MRRDAWFEGKVQKKVKRPEIDGKNLKIGIGNKTRKREILIIVGII